MVARFARGVKPFAVVASRVLQCETQAGRKFSITVHIGQPWLDEASGAYYCNIYLSKPKPTVTRVGGIDGISAISFALEIAGIKVFSALAGMRARSTSHGMLQDNGFPISPAVSQMLHSADAADSIVIQPPNDRAMK